MVENSAKFDRSQTREPNQKAFAINNNDIRGRSNVDRYNSFQKY